MTSAWQSHVPWNNPQTSHAHALSHRLIVILGSLSVIDGYLSCSVCCNSSLVMYNWHPYVPFPMPMQPYHPLPYRCFPPPIFYPAFAMPVWNLHYGRHRHRRYRQRGNGYGYWGGYGYGYGREEVNAEDNTGDDSGWDGEGTLTVPLSWHSGSPFTTYLPPPTTFYVNPYFSDNSLAAQRPSTPLHGGPMRHNSTTHHNHHHSNPLSF